MPDDARLYTRTAVYRKIMKIAHGEMRKGPYARLAFMQHYNNCNSIVTAVDKGESQSAFRIVSPYLPARFAQLGLFNTAGAPWAFCSLCMEASSWYTITLGQNAGIQAWCENGRVCLGRGKFCSLLILFACMYKIVQGPLWYSMIRCSIASMPGVRLPDWQHDKWYLKLAGRWFVKGWPHPELHHLRLGIYWIVTFWYVPGWGFCSSII